MIPWDEDIYLTCFNVYFHLTQFMTVVPVRKPSWGIERGKWFELDLCLLDPAKNLK